MDEYTAVVQHKKKYLNPKVKYQSILKEAATLQKEIISI